MSILSGAGFTAGGPDSAVLRLLEELHRAERRLGEMILRLEDVAAAAAPAADRTMWQTDAATRFSASADAWRREALLLPGALQCARDEVVRARLSVEARAWGSPR